MTKGTVGGLSIADGVALTGTVVDTTPGVGTAAAANWPAEGDEGIFSGTNFVTVSVDGSDNQTIDIPAGAYTGTRLAELMTLELNAKFGDEKSYKLPVTTVNRTITKAVLQL